MRTIALVAIGLLGMTDVAFGQQEPAPHSGHGFFIWRNTVFVMDDWERLRDGRAEAAIRAAQENVRAYQRLRAASEVPPTATARTDPESLGPALVPQAPRRIAPRPPGRRAAAKPARSR
jgi:hypothetical protein